MREIPGELPNIDTNELGPWIVDRHHYAPSPGVLGFILIYVGFLAMAFAPMYKANTVGAKWTLSYVLPVVGSALVFMLGIALVLASRERLSFHERGFIIKRRLRRPRIILYADIDQIMFIASQTVESGIPTGSKNYLRIRLRDNTRFRYTGRSEERQKGFRRILGKGFFHDHKMDHVGTLMIRQVAHRMLDQIHADGEINWSKHACLTTHSITPLKGPYKGLAIPLDELAGWRQTIDSIKLFRTGEKRPFLKIPIMTMNVRPGLLLLDDLCNIVVEDDNT
ncbi:MAG: hypothetical protein AB7Q00_10605 [Phycisphaerales bacterium]|nr:MAG: hypothetical protein IPK69_00440 [Phycisphaerales bacterium]